MANLNLKFLRGLQASLPTTGTDGYFYLTTDTHRLYTSVDGKVVPVNEGVVTVANIAALNDITANAGEFFYATEENVLCVFNGKNFIQINAQKTLAELGGVSQIAYDEKMTALEKADSDNSSAISGVDARLQVAEEKLKSVATTEGLGDLTDRVTAAEGEIDALQADSHTHNFADSDVEDAIAKKHAHTFTDVDVEDAISKKHAHTFVESELNKIAAGDVAKWNGVVADHLVAGDKTELADSIGDVNTALENYKTSNNEALAGVKATADAAATKEYADAELAKKVAKADYEADKATFATKTELNGVDAKFAQYNTTTAQKAIDDAQDAEIAKKADAEAMTTALAGKVDKAEGKSLIADSEIARLADVHNYDDTQVKADIAKKADSATMTTELGKKVDKVEGYSLVADAEIARLADVDNYDDAEVRGLIGDNADAIAEIAGDYVKAADIADFETKANVKKVADDLAAYAESNDAAVADRYTKSEADGKFAVKGEDAYDDAEVRGLISDNADAIAAETERATGIEAGLRTDVDAIKGDYLKNADKTALQEQITANANAITALTDGIDPDKIDGLTDLVNWANEHAPEVESIKNDIEANAKAIADQATSDAATYETKADATSKKTEIDGRLDALEGKVDVEKVSTAIADAVKVETDRATGVENGLAGRIKDLEDNKAGYATTGQVATAKQEAIDAAANDAASKYEEIGVAQTKVDALANGQVKANTEAIATKANAADVYAKTETFTKDEVNAAIAAAVEAAHTWGEF